MAHPDDADCLCGGTVAKWVGQGAQVTYVLCTDGGAGNGARVASPPETATRRLSEQQRACDLLGVSNLVVLPHRDGELMPTLQLRRQITGLVRRYRPEIVVCQSPIRSYGDLCINHPDHLAAGQSTVEAVYPAAQTAAIFPELLDEGLLPHHVQEVWLVGAERWNHFEEIEATVSKKIAAVRSHESQATQGSAMLACLTTTIASTGSLSTQKTAVERFYRIEVTP